jgi:CheY-like chemotaxis protein
LRRAARAQLQACGAHEAAPGEAPVAALQDGAVELSPVAPGAPPTVVMLAPEDRGAIAGLRAKGYAGYLIKPLRRVSLAERVRAAIDAGGRRASKARPPRPAPLDEREAGPASGLGLRVLLAEDNAVNALLASALLTRRGCSVVRAGSGDEAVAALADGGFDLVLMDMRMPGMSGLEATRAIRAAGTRTPVVALTANAFEDDRRACLEAGMNDFLAKPLDPAALDALFGRLATVTK